jgi:hypothetical protein
MVVGTIVGTGVCSTVGVVTAGSEAMFVHPPTRTNPIPHIIRKRMGSFIQGKMLV